MNVSGKITFFPKEVGKDNKIVIFETTISRKDESGNYVDNYTIRVQFQKSILPDEKKTTLKPTKAYSAEIEGFLTTRSYETKDGKRRIEPLLVVSKAKITGSKDVNRVKEDSLAPNEDLPF